MTYVARETPASIGRRIGCSGVGIGGAPFTAVNPSTLKVTVQGHPWIVGTAATQGVTVKGFVHGPASGGAATAGQASGVVQLVTPILISTTIGAAPVLPSFGILNLHFVPEPSTFFLLASGVLCLALAGLRRRRV